MDARITEAAAIMEAAGCPLNQAQIGEIKSIIAGYETAWQEFGKDSKEWGQDVANYSRKRGGELSQRVCTLRNSIPDAVRYDAWLWNAERVLFSKYDMAENWASNFIRRRTEEKLSAQKAAEIMRMHRR